MHSKSKGNPPLLTIYITKGKPIMVVIRRLINASSPKNLYEAGWYAK